MARTQRELIEELVDQGYRSVTGGALTLVYISVAKNHVVKISNDEGNIEFARHCLASPDVHLPRVSQVEFLSGGFGSSDSHAIHCELLEPVPAEMVAELDEWLSLMQGALIAGGETLEQTADLEGLKSTVVELWNIGRRRFAWDLGNGYGESKVKNLMRRPGYGEIVVIDPWVSADKPYSSLFA